MRTHEKTQHPPLAAAPSKSRSSTKAQPQAAQLHAPGKDASGSTPSTEQQPTNRTGLPDRLIRGMTQLSGMPLDDVRVHYGSAKPATLGAHAYTEGSQIFVAPGQERHVPHEAWHVVQQKQGRVQATRQLKGIAINDDRGLEAEADAMGHRALQLGELVQSSAPAYPRYLSYSASKQVPTPAQLVVQRAKNEQDAHDRMKLLGYEQGDYTLVDFESMEEENGNCHGFTFAKNPFDKGGKWDAYVTSLHIHAPAAFLETYLALKPGVAISAFIASDDTKQDVVAHSALNHDDECIHRFAAAGPVIKCSAVTMMRVGGYKEVYKFPADIAKFKLRFKIK